MSRLDIRLPRALFWLCALLLTLGLLLTAFGQWLAHAAAQAEYDEVSAGPQPRGFILYGDGAAHHCRTARDAREQRLLRAAEPADLRVFHGGGELRTAQQAGLRIILRGTPQLENFPDAKAAFIRAAQRWENLIDNAITVVIDVDYGPQRFGETYPEGVLGSTAEQSLGGNALYPTLRTRLLQSAGNPAETALYNALPTGQLPADLGNLAGAEASSILLRALGAIAPVADPEAEKPNFGNPPSIGFNSAFPFDFDPSDGIAANRTDFDATAVHELGHALGFTSASGLKELAPDATVRPSIWDFFRFRPGVNAGTFSTAPRILSSGGTHVFFGGAQELLLSTGKPDGTGGDEEQASHWKDDRYTGQYIGIMDPTLPRGRREEITANDLHALDTMGYRLRGGTQQQTEELKADDGTVETGLAGDGRMAVNRLTPAAYPSTLQKIRIYHAPAQNQPNPAGAQIRLLAFTAPSAPPANVTFLYNQPAAIPTLQGNGFVEYSITNGPTITSGDWYVGFQLPTPAAGVVAWADTNGLQQGRSFVSSNNGQTFTPLVFTGNVAANFLIRAVVTTGGGTQCTYAISPASQAFNATGGTGSVNVSANTGCNWTAASNVAWLTINGATSGSGNGMVSFTAAANTGTAPRTGTLTIAGQSFTVTQAGASQPTPTLTSLAPNTATAGGTAFTLTLNGTNFVNGSIVRWNGSNRATTFVSATQVRAQINAADIASAGNAGVSVFNPAPGGGTSNTVLFNINPATTGNVTALTSGAAQTGMIIAPPGANQGSYDPVQYTIQAPANATQLRVELSGNADVDLFVRFGARVDAQNDRLLADHRGESRRNDEQLVITPFSAPPLRPGVYYLVVANYGPGAANFSLTATSLTAADEAEREPNDSVATANPLFISSVRTGNVSDRDRAEVTHVYPDGTRDPIEDLYRFELTRDTLVDLLLLTPNASADLDLFLFRDNNGALTLQRLSVVDATVTGIPFERISAGLQPGRYVVGVSAYSGAAAYTLVAREIDNIFVSSASFSRAAGLASESIVTVFGNNLANATANATTVPLPTTLVGTTVTIRDSAGVERLAPLFFAAPTQLNLQLPSGLAQGLAVITVTNAAGQTFSDLLNITNAAPGLFTANADSAGVPAGLVVRVRGDGSQSFETIARVEGGRFVPAPIDLGPSTDTLVLVLFGTGIRGRSAPDKVQARFGNQVVPVDFAGAQGGLVGLDQVNIILPRALAGRGEVDLVLRVEGRDANTVKLNFK